MLTSLLHLMIILSQLLHCPGFSYHRPSSLGPSRWGVHDGWTTCRTGNNQSPIMLTPQKAQRIDIASLRYKQTRRLTGVFMNNGHVPVFIPDTDPNNELILQHVPDSLTSDFVFGDLHFHIGPSDNNGSEHAISNHANFTGEIHLVHWKRDAATPTLSAALQDPNGLAVVAVFFNVVGECGGEADRIIQQCVSRIVDVDETREGYTEPAQFLSPNRHYYTYRGSLTTPPCSENVRWIVFEMPTTICHKSFKMLQKLETSENGNVALGVFGNIRPIQRKDVIGIKKNF